MSGCKLIFACSRGQGKVQVHHHMVGSGNTLKKVGLPKRWQFFMLGYNNEAKTKEEIHNEEGYNLCS